MTKLDYAKKIARCLGTTVERAEEMLTAGLRAGLSMAYMTGCCLEMVKPKRKRKPSG